MNDFFDVDVMTSDSESVDLVPELAGKSKKRRGSCVVLNSVLRSEIWKVSSVEYHCMHLRCYEMLRCVAQVYESIFEVENGTVPILLS